MQHFEGLDIRHTVYTHAYDTTNTKVQNLTKTIPKPHARIRTYRYEGARLARTVDTESASLTYDPTNTKVLNLT